MKIIKLIFLFLIIFINNSFSLFEYYFKLGSGITYDNNPLLIENPTFSFSENLSGNILLSSFIKTGFDNFKYVILGDFLYNFYNYFSNNNFLINIQTGAYYNLFDFNLFKIFFDFNLNPDYFIKYDINTEYKQDIFDSVTIKFFISYNNSLGLNDYIENYLYGIKINTGYNFDITENLICDISINYENHSYPLLTNNNKILNKNCYSSEILFNYIPLSELEINLFYKIGYNDFEHTNLFIFINSNDIINYNDILINSIGFIISYDWNLNFKNSFSVIFDYYNLLTNINSFNLTFGLNFDFFIVPEFKINIPINYYINYSIDKIFINKLKVDFLIFYLI